MMKNLSNLYEEEIVLEIRELLDEVYRVKDEINVYCDLMKQVFLSGSNKN